MCVLNDDLRSASLIAIEESILSFIEENQSVMDRGRFDETGARPTSTRWFFLLIIASQIAGILAFVLIAILLGYYRGGFGWGVSSFRRSTIVFTRIL